MRASASTGLAVAVLLACTLWLPVSAFAQAAPSATALVGGLPAVIPIFPLPDSGLFPNASHDFHIFEPRYRAMIADALKGNRIIGMVMLQPGFEAEYDGRPPIFPIGCAGLITNYELLPDGRYNIRLAGLVKFRVTGEDPGQPYRLAHVTPLPEPLTDRDEAALHEERVRIGELIHALADQIGIDQLLPGVPDEQVVDELAQELPMAKASRYALLVQENSLVRGRTVVALLEAWLKEVTSQK